MENNKKILCSNIIFHKHCNYGNMCAYAHSLAEQKVDEPRYTVYKLIKDNRDLSTIDLINDSKLFNTFVNFTKVCKMCAKKICAGGYNCRHGVVDLKYQLCYDDLMFGRCKNVDCGLIHVTERGMEPYYIKKNKNKQPKVNNKFYKERFTQSDNTGRRWVDSDKIQRIENVSQGVLLTPQIISSQFTDSPLSDEENVEQIVNYLNSQVDDVEGSIFE